MEVSVASQPPSYRSVSDVAEELSEASLKANDRCFSAGSEGGQNRESLFGTECI